MTGDGLSYLIGCFPFMTPDSINNNFLGGKIRRTPKDAYTENQNIILYYKNHIRIFSEEISTSVFQKDSLLVGCNLKQI